MKRIYLDHAAATPLDSRVQREILSHLKIFGNPSSLYDTGRKAREIIEDARVRIGKILHCRPSELVFTGSGTEANNLAIFGVGEGHIVSTNIEHHSVLRPLEKRKNYTLVPVQKNGIINLHDIAEAIRSDTKLVSIIYANNEIGTIQQIKAIKKVLPKHVLFHVDACQAAGALNINVQELGVDLMTINGSKIYGPKGMGCLFVRRGTRLSPQILGGDQERGLRAGTENVALIAGFARAFEIAESMKEKENVRLTKLRDWFVAQLPEATLNGDAKERLPNNINISFDGIDGEMLMLALDLRGVEVSTGAACTISSNEPSHVLQAISAKPGNIRITLGRSTTKKDLEQTILILKKEVARLRGYSHR